jgi:hypothetical protein
MMADVRDPKDPYMVEFERFLGELEKLEVGRFIEEGKAVESVIAGMRAREYLLTKQGQTLETIFEKYKTAAWARPEWRGLSAWHKPVCGPSAETVILADFGVRIPDYRPKVVEFIVDLMVSADRESPRIGLEAVSSLNRSSTATRPASATGGQAEPRTPAIPGLSTRRSFGLSLGDQV